MNIDFYKSLSMILSNEDKYRIFRLASALILISIIEVIGISLIAFTLVNFQNLASSINSLPYMGLLISSLGLSKINTIYLFCIGILAYSLATLLLSILLLRALNFSSQLIGSRVRLKLIRHFLYSDWMDLYSLQATQQIANIFNDGRQVGFIISFCLNLLSRIILSIVIIAFLFLFNAFFTMILVTTLVSSYFIIFSFLKPFISRHGKNTADLLDKSLKTLLNIFNSIKEIIFYKKQEEFISIFGDLDKDLIYSEASNVSLSQIPRLIIDFFLLVMLMLGVLYISFNNFSDQAFFAALSVYGLAALKLLPALQNIYYFYHEILAREAHLQNITKIYQSMDLRPKKIKQKINFKDNIAFNNISFSYEQNEFTALTNVSTVISIPKNTAIIGPTGSGKTTFLDILIGFTEPESGYLSVDGNKLLPNERETIRHNFSYVPQKVYLIEATLRENILFGSTLDEKRLDEIIHISQLTDVVDSLPKGLDTILSDSNALVSGGQKQCIGFARALYKNADILIIDEGTNAMDQKLESKIISSIDQYNISSIICITHKASLLKYFDDILIFNSGKLDASGTYEDLSKSNKFLQTMIEADKKNINK
jgi:ABC-type bacteriocin/lantibiotic exporter with double-glycine peptidase domain